VNETLIAELEQEAAPTRRVLERVPGAKLAWRPHPRSMSLGQLAFHTASIPGNLAGLIDEDKIDVDTVDFRPPSATSPAHALEALEQGLGRAREFLKRLDPGRAAAPWRLVRGGRELFTLPRMVAVRTLMFNHWYHHRGQLAVYLRLLDVPVPAIYGTSADENPLA
jgi:uncharacterized damage-inducible protein DinB